MLLNNSPRNNLRHSINLKTNITILKIYQNSSNKFFPKKIKTNTQSNSISINEEKKNKEKNNLTDKKNNNIYNEIYKTRNFSYKKNIRHKSMNNKINKNFDNFILKKENISFIKKYKNNIQKIVFIQRWWRTISCIILIQKVFRGFLFRFKNMNIFKIKVNKNSNIRKRNIPNLIHRINIGKKLLNSSIEDNIKIRHSFSKEFQLKTNFKRLNSYSGLDLLLDDINNSIKKVKTNNFIITSQYNFSVIDKKKIKNPKKNNNKSKIKKSHSQKKTK